LVSTTALQLTKILIPGTSVKLYCNTSSGKPCPYVPSPLRRQIFNSLHSLSHPSIKATAKLISQRFVWPAIQKDFRTWARACQRCSASKFPDTQSLLLATSPSLVPTSFMFTSTFSAHYHPWQGFDTGSRWWTISRAGQKPSPFPTSHQKQCHVPYSRAGYHILAAHRQSTPTRDASSSHSFSTAWRSCVVYTSPG
jgi:hypothetical protein